MPCQILLHAMGSEGMYCELEGRRKFIDYHDNIHSDLVLIWDVPKERESAN